MIVLSSFESIQLSLLPKCDEALRPSGNQDEEIGRSFGRHVHVRIEERKIQKKS